MNICIYRNIVDGIHLLCTFCLERSTSNRHKSFPWSVYRFRCLLKRMTTDTSHRIYFWSILSAMVVDVIRWMKRFIAFVETILMCEWGVENYLRFWRTFLPMKVKNKFEMNPNFENVTHSTHPWILNSMMIRKCYAFLPERLISVEKTLKWEM